MAEQPASLDGVVAAEVGSFTDLGQRVVECLAALELQQRNETRATLFDQLGRTLEPAGATRVPARNRSSGCDGAAPPLRRFDDAAYDRRLIDRRYRAKVLRLRRSPAAATLSFAVATSRSSLSSAARSPNSTPREFWRAGEYSSDGKGSFGCRADAGADHLGWPAQQFFDRHGGIGSNRDERRIRTVLEQTPHQIGKEIPVAADRRVGPARDLGAILAQLLVQGVAHAVQPLEFEELLPRKLDDGCDRQGVVGGKLREEPRR